MTTTKALANAINTIATFMTEMSQKQDRDTGQIVEVNLLGYAQRRVLNGLAYSVALTLQNSQQQHDEAVAKINFARRSHRGDELSDVQLNRAIDWAERLELQIAALEALLEVAAEAHEEHTGEKFVRPAKAAMVNRKFTTAALERAAKYGQLSETTMGGGVEVAQAEAA